MVPVSICAFHSWSHGVDLAHEKRSHLVFHDRRVARLIVKGARGALAKRSGRPTPPNARLVRDLRERDASPWTLHDLRRTFSTRLGNLGGAPHIVGA